MQVLRSRVDRTWLLSHCITLSLFRECHMENSRCRHGRAVQAMREGFRVLHVLGLAVTPSKFKVIEWLPEPILILAV